MDEYLSVTEVAQKLGISSDTVRRWDKKGLIKSQRSPQNHRLFNVGEVAHVAKQLKGEASNKYKILKSKKTNLTSIDLFAGAGGTALGLENAGFKHLLLSEMDKSACQTLRVNRPNWNVVEGDVANVDFRPYSGKVDLVEGGFPCQAFSFAGKKLGFEDTRGTLFYEFARAIKETMPKVAVGENVKGLLSHDGGRTLETMLDVLKSITDESGNGYEVSFKVLRSQYLDVPQKRERLVIVAIRKDIFSGDFYFPQENNYVVTLRDAIGDKPKGLGSKYPPRKAEIMDMVPPGGYWRDLPEEVQKEYLAGSYFLGGGKTGMARRLSWDEPSLTLTCAPAQKQTERCHPSETRPLNVAEYARIQTFPDLWIFPGSVAQTYKQIGNAVPVNLGYHIGKMVEQIINSAPKKK
jgi:DNA (cytosine-5)-methyltransferase 1